MPPRNPSPLKPLPRWFYTRDTVTVAKALLGQYLVVDGRKCKIVETEAYLGLTDPSCHSYGDKRSPRTRTMYMEGGYAYVYFIYGMYNCVNVVTQKKGVPEAVLIRGVEIEGEEPKTGAGPGKLCRFLEITRADDGTDLTDQSSRLWIAKGSKPKAIVEKTRIGLSHKEAKEWPLRFYIEGHPSVSKK